MHHKENLDNFINRKDMVWDKENDCKEGGGDI
jgi:hypothetical protein